MSRLADPDALRAAAETLGVSCSAADAESLFRYLDLLYFWNESAGLTTIDHADAPELHLLDSLAAEPLIGRVSTVIDIGTGAGLPGIPLAVVRPEVSFTLVDSNRRKVSFLAEAVRTLGLTNVRVRRAKAEAIVESGERFDIVVSRAFRAPAVFAEIAIGLLGDGGKIVVMTSGRQEREALAAAPAGTTVTDRRDFVLPGGASRSIVALATTAPS